ncbi:hypothetical protein ACFLU6_10225 [Acidobacteriota bacterium]
MNSNRFGYQKNRRLPLSLRHGASTWAPRRGGPPPTEVTKAEHYYLLKQLSRQTTLVVHLKGGETISGKLEWYDQNTLKIYSDKGKSVIIPKHSIKYLFKGDEEKRSKSGRRPQGAAGSSAARRDP